MVTFGNAMSGYKPVFKSILQSTIWECQPHVKVVWLCMLLMCDRDGIVEGSVPGLARSAVVTREQCEEALRVLSEPDPDSRTTDNEGRRIEPVDGGWRLLNHTAYQLRLGLLSASNRERVARFREKKRLVTLHVTDGNHLDLNLDLNKDQKSEEKKEKTREVRAPKKPKPVAVECPEFLQPTEATIAVGVVTGRSWVSDFAAMRDWALGKGERKVDWQAALRGWMRRAAEQSPRGQGGNVGRQVKPPQPNAEDERDRYVARRLGETDDDLSRRTAEVRSGKRGLYD